MRLSNILLSALVAFTVGCGSTESTTEHQPAVENNTAAAKLDIDVRRRSTKWQKAIENLAFVRGNIERMYDVASADSRIPSLAKTEQLMGVLTEASSRLGMVHELDRVVELGEAAVKQHPKAAKAFLLRARSYAAVHRFADAKADLQRATAVGASAEQTGQPLAVIAMAEGDYATALPLLRAAKEARPTHSSIALEAMCLGKMGELEAADKLFGEALRAYRNVSPFVFGWLYFERGAMWDHAGQASTAQAYYAEAVRRMPLYAHAVGHLALQLPSAEAMAVLEPVVENATDPEYLGLLGALREARRPGSGKTQLAKARAGYELLMRRHPLAFADHAGWFYLTAARDTQRAVELAEMNLGNRKSPEAYSLMMAALVAHGSSDEACSVADVASGFPYPSASLMGSVADAFDQCGRAERASELRKRFPNSAHSHSHVGEHRHEPGESRHEH